MNKKRSLMFTLVRGTAAILIALLVATVLIFISAEGATSVSYTHLLPEIPPGDLHRFGVGGMVHRLRPDAHHAKQNTDLYIGAGGKACLLYTSRCV